MWKCRSGLLADNVSKQVARSSYGNEDIPASSSHYKQQDEGNEDSPATCKKFNHLHSHPSAQPPLFMKKRERLGEDFQMYTRKRHKKPEFQVYTKKTLILDVNGLLADIVINSAVKHSWSSNPFKIINNKAVFKRPHVENFLKFCFERFHVGVWSSRLKVNLDPVLDYVFGNNYKSKLAFQWDQEHCTNTGDKAPGGKPMFLKEIQKLWEDPELRQERGGDIRVYLEKLSSTSNVQKFVEQNKIPHSRV
ncbi:hypothetical protein ACET3Z_028182 [Daucus carota]